MQLKCIIILSAETHFYSHVWFLNEFEVVLKPPEGKGLFLELPYHGHNPQLGTFMSSCSVIGIGPSPVAMFTYQGREETLLQGIVSLTRASTQFLLLQRECRNVRRDPYQQQKNFALKKSYLGTELAWASPADFSYPGLWPWTNHLVCLGLYFPPPPPEKQTEWLLRSLGALAISRILLLWVLYSLVSNCSPSSPKYDADSVWGGSHQMWCA